jgi:hypothetical protein
MSFIPWFLWRRFWRCARVVGLAWGTLYSVIEVANLGSFQASSDLADALRSTKTRQSVLVYYSFVTLTTVGYGDITPVSPAARTLAWLEAMMGQFYIAVLVAFLIGIRVSQGPIRKEPVERNTSDKEATG